MKQRPMYTIGELAQAAGVTTRTIRYYSAEGLLPPPDTRGKFAGYGDAHLHRLQLIGRLKAAYLPLQEIRARLERLSPEEVARLLEETPPATQQRQMSSASDYLQRVLTGGGQAQPARERRPSRARETTPAMERDILVGLQAEPVASPTAPGRPHPPYIAEEGAVYGAEPSPGERWQRVTLAPGVELHLRHPVDAEHRAAVDELLARADGLFRSDT
ncbi:MAG: MerR family transcriptional regulator [Chloroflexota bacterium]|nr:MerR family transcriptional regulator [Chloroflexota bacterium]